MKRYKLLKDLPAFKAGEEFVLAKSGNLVHTSSGEVAYTAKMLDQHPDAFTGGWFEEVKEEWSPWRAGKWQTYFYIDDTSETSSSREEFNNVDYYCWRIGNYFKTIEEAELAKAKLVAYATIKKDTKGFKADWDKRNWNVSYDRDDYQFKIFYSEFLESVGQIYFASEEDAQHSLDIHRKEWETLFGLEEGNHACV